MVVGTQSSPLVISVDGAGNDIFLYWVSDCHDSRNASELEFDFLKGTSVHEQSRADFCKLRFKKKLFTRMYALSSHNSSPGIIIYDSDRRKEVEYSNPINYSALGLEFLYRHPEYQTQYEQFLERENSQLLENGDFPDSDLPNQYDDFRLQRMLNNQKVNINNRQNSGNSPMIDQNEYNPQDDPSEDAVYPPYYVQQKYDNLGNDLYYPLDYYRDTTGNNPENYAYSRNFRPKKVGVSANQFRGLQNPYESFSSVNMNNQRDNKPHEKPLRRYMPRQQRSRIGGNWMKSLRYAKPEPRHTVKRIARHVGPHDGGGIQRVISTGTLAPILNSKSDQGIDVIFATFWFFPSSIQGLLPQDKKCIEAGMMREEGRFKPTSQFYGMDHDAYEEMVAEECLRKSGNLRNDKPSSTQEYNPFNRPMGQMTVYRIHVKCKCSNSTAVSSCRKVLPFEQQGWPSYMGRNGNSVANPSHSH